jgi:hypothetical protein
VNGFGEDLVLKGTSTDHIADGLRGWLDGTLCLPSREACREHVMKSFTWDKHRETGLRSVPRSRVAVEIIMKKNARITLMVLLTAGLWLALKPTVGNRRLTFLPVRWSEYVDCMDFWFNLGAFAILGATAWLAFGAWEKALSRAVRDGGHHHAAERAAGTAAVFDSGKSDGHGRRVGGPARLRVGDRGRNDDATDDERQKNRWWMSQVSVSGSNRTPWGCGADAAGHCRRTRGEQRGHPVSRWRVSNRTGGRRREDAVFRLGDEASAVDKQAGLFRVLRSIPGIIRL